VETTGATPEGLAYSDHSCISGGNNRWASGILRFRSIGENALYLIYFDRWALDTATWQGLA